MFKEIGKATEMLKGFLNVSTWTGTWEASDIKAMAVSVSKLSTVQQAAVLSSQNLNNELIAQTLAANGATESEIAQAMATAGLIVTNKNLTFAEAQNTLTAITGNAEKAKAIMLALNLTEAQNGEIVGLKNLTRETILAAAAQEGLNTAQAQGVIKTLSNGASLQRTPFLLRGIGNEIKMIATQLGVVGTALAATAAVVAAVAIGVSIWSRVQEKRREREAQASLEEKRRREENIEKIKEEAKSYTESVKNLKDYTDTYEKLSKKISLSTDDKEELLKVQNSLYDSYGKEAESIDLVNGKYEDQIEKLKQLTTLEIQRARQAAQIAYDETKKSNQPVSGNASGAYFGFGKSESDIVVRSKRKGRDLGLFQPMNFGDGVQDYVDRLADRDTTIEQLDKLLKWMDDLEETEEKATEEYKDFVQKLVVYRDELLAARDEEIASAEQLAQLDIFEFTLNGINYQTVTKENYQSWHDAMIKHFASDDTVLQAAIEKKLDDMYEWLNPENVDFSFDFADFYNQNGLEDIEKLLGKIQTAYKNLEETGNGFALDSDILSAFPDLAKYLDDAETLKFKLQQLANAQMQPLIDQLRDIQSTLNPLSSDYSEVENLINWLQQQADVTAKVKEKTTKVSDLYKDQKLQIHENIQALEREVKTIDKQIDALEKKKDLQEKYIKTLEKEKDRLEDLIDDYETAASVVKDYIDEQNDGLEKQKDKIEERYDAQIKAIEETYDKQVKLIEAQEEGFDKQIKALQDEADEQDKLNKLKEKELALEKAKNEKVRVYTAEKGWQIMENSEAVSAARKELEEAQREDTIAKLEKEKERLEQEKERLQAEKEQRTSEIENLREKEIEALQVEMDKLKEYKKAWEEAIGAYKKAQEEMTAAAILGADWRVKVAGQDTEIIEDYKDNYEGLQNQLNNSVIPMIEIANKELDTYSEQIDKLKEQKDLYKDMEDNQKKYLDFYKTYAEQFADATNQQKEAVEALNKAIAMNTALSNMNDTDKTWDWAKSLFDEDYIREYPDFKGGTTNDSTANNGLIGKLMGIFNQSTSVYDSFAKTIPNLLNNASSSLSDKIINAGKMIADTVTNNKNNVDNRTQTINVNNPGFAMTEAAFMSMLTGAFVKMNQESQIGKK